MLLDNENKFFESRRAIIDDHSHEETANLGARI
jgi:hypothetical protein